MFKFLSGAATGGGLGAWIGSSMGVAALGTAVSGLLPLAVAGAVIGGLLAVVLTNR